MIAVALLWGAVLAQSPPVACRDWHECQQQALEAAGRRDYESFHDLAWRTVQLGPRQDPTLMFMLARAQCLSGRPHDALVMLRRIASSGVATAALTDEDFQRTRDLPEWSEVQALLEGTRPAAPTTAPRATKSPPPTVAGSAPAVGDAPPPPRASDTAASPAPVVKTPAVVDQTVRLESARFAAGGLAYDTVSHRFVVGDERGRKLMVVSEGADHAIDLVRADSAGFRDIKAVEIDGRRGDLWVASASGDDWTIHRMQLVSGRPLKSIQASGDGEPLNLTDLAVTPAGNVLAIDGAGGRVFMLRPSGASLEIVARVTPGATSITSTSDEDIAYVAQGGGIARVDRGAKTVTNLTAAKGVEFGRIERIRWHRNALIAVQTGDDGIRRIVRLAVNRSGRAVTSVTPLDTTIPAAAGPTFATVAGDELCYLVVEGDGPATQFTIRRMRLP